MYNGKNPSGLYLPVCLCLLAVSVAVSWANDKPIKDKILYIPVIAASSEIQIDGSLSEAAWQQASKLELPVEIYPLRNEPAQVKTECYITYNAHYLFVGFRAFENNRSSLRGHISNRDAIENDDRVGFVIDTLNDESRGYSFFSNYRGIQEDAYRDDFGSGVDHSWDAIWKSAGSVTDEGYEVEFAIPFSQIRFQDVDGEQIWGFNGVRIRPREIERETATQPIKMPATDYFKQFTKLKGFRNIEKGRNIQLSPTFTAVRSDQRESMPDGDFAPRNEEAEFGVTGKWSISPSLTMDLTLNPDFSQVAADVAQLDVNINNALFFEEKRPFFLEGANSFDTLLNIVHTRQIADPEWGVKLSGQIGKDSVGILSANDRQTNILLATSQFSRATTLNIESRDTIARYLHNIGNNSALGLLVTNREGEDYRNQVGGIDGEFNLTSVDSIKFQFLGSTTEYPDDFALRHGLPQGDFSDYAMRVNFVHNTRTFDYFLYYTDIGDNFRADTGYIPRVGIKQVFTGVGYSFWGEKDSTILQNTYWAYYRHYEDQNGRVLYNGVDLWTAFLLPKQSRVYYYFYKYQQHFRGSDFDLLNHRIYLSSRPSGDVSLVLSGYFGDYIDFSNVREGSRLLLTPYISFRPGSRVSLSLNHTYEKMNVDGGRLYLANLSQFTMVYYFNAHSFFRLITQYTDVNRDPDLYRFNVQAESRKLFNQLLYSYKINPQTVLHIGYSDDYVANDTYDLTKTGRTLFFKIGYAWLF